MYLIEPGASALQCGDVPEDGRHPHDEGGPRVGQDAHQGKPQGDARPSVRHGLGHHSALPQAGVFICREMSNFLCMSKNVTFFMRLKMSHFLCV